MADREAAGRLKRALRVAMAAKGINSWEELALGAKISPTTVENWTGGRTVPRAKEIRIMGEYLRPHSSPAALEAAYAGIEPEEPAIIEVLREMAPDLHELVVLLRAQADQAVLAAVRTALEERRQRRGADDEGRLGEPPDGDSG